MSDLVYTVTAYRWGSRENHSYVVGVYSNEVKALDAADREASYRDGKYDCEVIGWVPDQGLAGLERKQDSARTVIRSLPESATLKGVFRT